MTLFEIMGIGGLGVAVALCLWAAWDNIQDSRARQRTPLHSQANADDRTARLPFSPLETITAPEPAAMERGDGERAQRLPTAWCWTEDEPVAPQCVKLGHTISASDRFGK